MPAYCQRLPVADVPPFFRLLATTAAPGPSRACGPALRSFQPRFDVREDTEAFHLVGELPGVAASDVTIEFADQSTLVVRGRRHRNQSSGTVNEKADQQIDTTTTTAAADAAAAPNPSTAADAPPKHQHHAPTVEDEDYVDAAADVADTDSTAPTIQADGTTPQPEAPTAPVPAATSATPDVAHKSRYWVSERAVGDFRRSFSFQKQVDQGAVRASLKDGILSIVVPKKAEEKRRIRIE